ncbi:MAG: protein TolQ [Desulfovibrionales bacterium]
MEVFPETGLWSMMSGATLVVKLVLILLVLMSLISWTIIFYKWIVLTAAKKRAERELNGFINAESLGMAMQFLRQNSKSSLFVIGSQGLSELKRLEKSPMNPGLKVRTAMDTLRRVLRRGVNQELGRLSSSLSFLATCGNAAPFIGLFGTVWGIMNSFHSIGMAKSASLATVAPGISEALVATAIGLAVAIPATVAYNFFLGMLHKVEGELVNFAGAFLNRVQRELPMVSSQGAKER